MKAGSVHLTAWYAKSKAGQSETQVINKFLCRDLMQSMEATLINGRRIGGDSTDGMGKSNINIFDAISLASSSSAVAKPGGTTYDYSRFQQGSHSIFRRLEYSADGAAFIATNASLKSKPEAAITVKNSWMSNTGNGNKGSSSSSSAPPSTLVCWS
jgi:hypothetical protein